MTSDVTTSEAVPASSLPCRCYFMASFGADSGRWPLKGRTCFLVANEVLNPASCLYQEHLDQPEPGQARQWSQSSISTKVCPFKTSRTLGHKLPHFIKRRQDRMRAETAHSLCTRKLLFIFTRPLPGLQFYTP